MSLPSTRRQRSLLALLIWTGGCVVAIGAAVACGETLVATNEPPAADASPLDDGIAPSDDGASTDADAESDATIDVAPFDLEERPICPRADGGPTPCTGVAIGSKPCLPDVLFDPPGPEHVFGIAADRRHAFWLSQAVVADAEVAAYNGAALATLRRVDRLTHEAGELARDQKGAAAVHAYGAHVFWGAEEPVGSGKYVVRMLRKDAAPCTKAVCPTPITLATNLPRVRDLAVLGTDALLVVTGDGALHRVIISGPSSAKIGQSTAFTGFAVGEGVAYLSGAEQQGVERYDENGAQLSDLGVIPDASMGADWLLTTCPTVFAHSPDNQIRSLPADASNDTFVRFTDLANPFQVYSATSDSRFLYYGAANGQGFRRVDTTTPDAAAVEIAKGSVWGIAVTEDAVIYAEHGNPGGNTPANIGTVYSLAK